MPYERFHLVRTGMVGESTSYMKSEPRSNVCRKFCGMEYWVVLSSEYASCIFVPTHARPTEPEPTAIEPFMYDSDQDPEYKPCE